jgi:hypothetical protein
MGLRSHLLLGQLPQRLSDRLDFVQAPGRHADDEPLSRINVRAQLHVVHRLAHPRGREICPRWPVSRSCEVGELGDVVDFHLVDASARLAQPREEPGDQLLQCAQFQSAESSHACRVVRQGRARGPSSLPGHRAIETGENMSVWFVTGASRGLGAGITREALDRGHSVIATARDVSAVRRLTSTFPSLRAALPNRSRGIRRPPDATAGPPACPRAEISALNEQKGPVSKLTDPHARSRLAASLVVRLS